jgi:hypothetical protein
MKKVILLATLMLLMIAPVSVFGQIMEISADDGDLYEIISADTLADGTQANIYVLTSKDKTYKMSGTITAKGDLTIMGEMDEDDEYDGWNPATIQSAVLADGSTVGTLFVLTGDETEGNFMNLYLLAKATNNVASGVAIEVKGDHTVLNVGACVFDAWHTFAIAYNGQWDSFYIEGNIFRNMVHPNQWYIGEVLRNTWPGEAYTDTVVMEGNLMMGVNGYAAAPVTKWHMNYFEFNDNVVLYTFKNPFFIFNMTEGTMNDNVFYGNYAGGVDRTEDPWWDNLWFPDTSFGVIALQPLSPANAIMFDPAGDTSSVEGLAAIEAQRDIEISGNTVHWPAELTAFWDAYNDTATNWIRTPVWMNDRTVAMFADDDAYPHLVQEANFVSPVEIGLPEHMNDAILHGTAETGDIGFLDYFLQIRGGTAATDHWGYAHTVVEEGNEDWTPQWPTQELLDLGFYEDDFECGDGCMEISADDGDLYEIISADTLADGTQAHEYVLTSTDVTYKMSGTITAKGDLTIVGELNESTNRPPAIQSAVLADGSTVGTLFVLTGDESEGYFENLYLLAQATNGVASGVAIEVKGDETDLFVGNCVLDGFHTFAIAYNGQWDNFYIWGNVFRNLVHPNQWYIGEVLRNTWPGEAYTGEVWMEDNLMIGVNGYAAAPVSKWYMESFNFNDNAVLFTFKNPFFIFNMTEGEMNGNVFYGNYAGGVDRTEDPWWDNLWYPDTSFGVIALQPLSPANAIMFDPDGDTSSVEGLAAIEAQRDIEISDNIAYWPVELSTFWEDYNDTATNWIRTPVWMNDRTVEMFDDDDAYPNLNEENNFSSIQESDDPGMPPEMLDAILNGTSETGDIGLLDYFLQIRGGTAATDYWGYGHTVVGDEGWIPTWPLPEMVALDWGDYTAVENEPLPERFTLEQNFPNPFNPITEITFTLNQESDITLTIFNMLGQEVKELTSGFKPVGKYTVQWNGKDNLGRSVSTGVYLYSLNNGTQVLTKKMVLMK